MSMHTDVAFGKSDSSCLWSKGRADTAMLPLDFDILQTVAGVLLVCPWAEISKGAVGLRAAKLRHSWLFPLRCWAHLAAVP